MFVQRLQRVGGEYIITISPEVVEQLGLHVNELVTIEMYKPNDYQMSEEVAAAWHGRWNATPQTSIT